MLLHFPEEDWTKLLELSPLFQMLKVLELQLKNWASGAGLLRREVAGQWDVLGVIYFHSGYLPTEPM